MNCCLLGSSVHGIFQARTLEWIAISFSRGSSWTREWTWVSCIAGRFFTRWATREALSVCYYSLHCLSSDVPVSRAVRTLLFARIILPGLTLPSPSFLSPSVKQSCGLQGIGGHLGEAGSERFGAITCSLPFWANSESGCQDSTLERLTLAPQDPVIKRFDRLSRSCE